jgi:2-(1,2-epoxy-1,2-dihydrophenyl)acetyl-CoA isomerase
MLVSLTSAGEHIVFVEFGQPPNNFFDVELIGEIVDAYVKLSADTSCRAIVLCSEGKHFCAGANFRKSPQPQDPTPPSQPQPHLYDVAIKLFEQALPVVAAVQGGAIGGGLGLALSADFRIATPETRFAANFARIGIHQGFGLTATLPRLVGQQRALEMLYTGRDVFGEEAFEIGLCDRLVAADLVRTEAVRFAQELALSAPLAVRSIRQTLRGELASAIRAVLARELSEQTKLRLTADFKKGVGAKPGHPPRFEGK